MKIETLHWDRGANYDGPSCGAGTGFTTGVINEVTCNDCVMLIRRQDSGFCVPCQRGLCVDCTGGDCACSSPACNVPQPTVEARLDALEERVRNIERGGGLPMLYK